MPGFSVWMEGWSDIKGRFGALKAEVTSRACGRLSLTKKLFCLAMRLASICCLVPQFPRALCEFTYTFKIYNSP